MTRQKKYLISSNIDDDTLTQKIKGFDQDNKSINTRVIKEGALGFGISGSGPSVYALAKGSKNGNRIAYKMKSIINQLGIDFDIYISKINNQGIKIISD